MIFNFTAGALIGAAMTYIYKDQDAKEKVMAGLGSLKDKTENLAEDLTSSDKDKDDEKVVAKVDEAAEATEEVKAAKTA